MRDLRDLEIDAFLSQAEHLASLMTHPTWDSFTALVLDMRRAALEELARVTDPTDFRFWQGAAAALGEILDRPKRIVEAAADHLRTEEADKPIFRPELRAIFGVGVDPGESL